MLNIKKHLAAVAFTLLAVGGVAQAGRGGSAARIRNAVQTHSVDAIVAEVERAEKLVCADCKGVMTELIHHDRYEVRQVAAWWWAKRPAYAAQLTSEQTAILATGDAIAVRDAADYLGTVKAYGSADALLAAYDASGDADTRLHIVKAAGRMADLRVNSILIAGMADADAAVRKEAVDWYRDVLQQSDAAPVYPLLGDPDAVVRAHAATVIGGLKGAGARATLENLAINDPDAKVRSNSVWALGEIGDSASRDVIRQAQHDPSGLVRRVANGALSRL